MLLPTTTWGQLREIALQDIKNGTQSSDNLLLRNPELLTKGSSKKNEDYFWPEEAKLFLEAMGEDPEAITAAGSPEEEPESPLYFTVDDDGNVLELIKSEEESLSIRVDGEWVDISSEDEFPTVYEQTMKPATDDSVGAWDSELESNDQLKLEDIRDYINE